MPLVRKRRAQAEALPSPSPTRRRHLPSESDASSVDEDVTGEIGYNGDTPLSGSHEQMAKKLVRLALASEYSRQPIRRNDITAKVLAPNSAREFRHVFNEAQRQLRTVFGMEMTELPQKEKITISQKRAAQRSQSAISSSKSYVLTSTLPAQYRTPKILAPPRAPSTATEASYTGLYTFIISVIALSPRGTIPESRLERHLKRMNADNHVLNGEKTEKVFKRMEREGYIVKVRERDGGGEESIDYVVGPRGKAEIGEKGVAGVVRKVYGNKDTEADELEKKLVRSLGDVAIEKKSGRTAREAEEDGNNGETDKKGGRGAKSKERRTSSKSNKRSRDENEDGEEEEDEEEEEGDEGEEEGDEEEEEEDEGDSDD